MKLWDIASPDHPLVHSFTNVHPLGVHHVATSKDGKVAASTGFGGETFLWDLQDLKQIGNLGGILSREANVVSQMERKVELTKSYKLDEKLSGEVWAISLSPNGNLLAATTYDGRINIWNTLETGTKLRQYETKGSFGMCVEIVRPPHMRFLCNLHKNSLRRESSSPRGMKTVVYTFSTLRQDEFSILYLVSLEPHIDGNPHY